MLQRNWKIMIIFLIALLSGLSGFASPQRLACFYFDRNNPHPSSYFFNFSSSPLPFVWAKNNAKKDILFEGKIINGFFEIDSISQKDARNLCENTFRVMFPRSVIQLMQIAVKISSWNKSRFVPVVFSREEGKKFNKLVIFGDSLSDQGRIKDMVGIVPGRRYFAGRFSNLRIWVDYFQEATGLAVQNLATAGSLTGNITGINLNANKRWTRRITDDLSYYFSGTLEDQLELYRRRLNNNQHQETLFLIWSGPNDYFVYVDHDGIVDRFLDMPDDDAGHNTVIRRVTGNIEKAIRTLYAEGARHFLIPNMPSLGALPKILSNTTYGKKWPQAQRLVSLSNKMNHVSNQHNSMLQLKIEALKADLAEINIILIDIAEDIKTLPVFAMKHTTEISYEDSRASIGRACYRSTSNCPFSQGICEDPDEMFFWDEVHPSSKVHCFFGAIIQKAAAKNALLEDVSLEDYLKMYQPIWTSGCTTQGVGKENPALE